LKELISYLDLETNTPPSGHLMPLMSLLWAIAFALSEYIELQNRS
jgi:hypothetical protein